MKDQNKTKAQLIAELEEARKLISELEQRNTECGETGDKLILKHQLWDALLANTPDLVYFKDKDHGLIMASQTYANAVGLDQKDLIGKTAVELWPHEAKEIMADERRVLAGEPILQEERKATNARGEKRSYLLTKIPIYRGGEIIGFFAVDKDITERAQAKKALRESKQRLSTLMKNLPGIAYRGLNKPNWPMEFISEGCLTLTGYSPSELTNDERPFYGELIHPEDQKMVWENIQNGVRTQSAFVLEYRLIDRGGKEHWVWERGQLVDKKKNGISVLEGFISDITDRVRAEEELTQHRQRLEKLVKKRTAELEQRVSETELLNQSMLNLMEDARSANRKLTKSQQELQQLNQELESFAYSVSHDLRAPLRHISSFATLLQNREKDHLEEKSLGYLENVISSTTRMSQLIDDLLAFSRAGRRAINLRRVDTEQIITEVRQEMEPEIEYRAITWNIAPLPAVQADPKLLRIVWSNLLSNALKYTQPRAKAQIEINTHPSEEDENMVVFYVRDNGVGFNMNYVDKIFGVFQRLHNDNEFEGTGIGLATVRRLVNRHGGRVWAEGEVGMGATFYFTMRSARGSDSDSDDVLTKQQSLNEDTIAID